MSYAKLSCGSVLLVCLCSFACTRSETTPPRAGVAPTATATTSPTPQQSPCPAEASWITAPNPPTEIGGGVPIQNETNCQFYQFAYQWFFSMVQPVGTSGERKFETLNVYQPNQQNQCATPTTQLTGKAAIARAFFVRTPKPKTNDFNAVIPKDINQAIGGPLYDQNGNVVLYYVLYSPNECQATASGFLPNTMEIKSSWRILKAADPTYYTMTATIDGVSTQPVTLGLVGFHLTINTKNHQEFVWATFEHVNNAPDCTNPQSPPAAGWSFLSSTCATCLQQKGVSGCPQCNFNNPPPSPTPPATPTPTPGIVGTANQVCRVYRDGTDPGSMTNGNNNDTNRFNIDTLNSQIATFLAQLPPGSPMSVWKNYVLIAGLWTNGGVGSGTTDAQRGSLEAANSTMETFFQQPNQNCFSCHGYDPTTPLTVSHIASDLLPSNIAPKRVKATK